MSKTLVVGTAAALAAAAIVFAVASKSRASRVTARRYYGGIARGRYRDDSDSGDLGSFGDGGY